MPGKMFSNMPNEFDVKRKDLFSVEFPVEMNIPEQFIINAARPKISNPRKELLYKNLPSFYKGKTTLEEMTLTFRDPIGPSILQKLYQWQRQHTDLPTGQGGYAATYKKTLTVNLEDPTGQVIEKYIYYGCFITSLDAGDLDMSSDDPSTVTLTISYDSFEII